MGFYLGLYEVSHYELKPFGQAHKIDEASLGDN